ncbi:MAG: hypothetical protein WA865_17405 [Spirulinaceae cyanobacterium]
MEIYELSTCRKVSFTYEEHPLNNQDKPLIMPKGKLIFQGVRKSERFIYEYYIDSGGKQKGKPGRKVIDGPFIEPNEDVEAFVIEGVLKQPWAWISWDIESVSFELEVI